MFAAAIIGVASVAVAPSDAQVIPPTLFTESTTASLTFNPATTVTQQVNAFSTEVVGRLNGGTLFDQTFNVAVSDPTVQSALLAARTAITTAGGPGVFVGSARLVSSVTSTGSSSSSIYSLAGSVVTVTVEPTTIGPGTVFTGTRSSCSIGSLPSSTAPTCTSPGGTPLTLLPGQRDFNVNTDTNYLINTTTTTIVTTTLNQVWEVDGTTRQVGTVHTAAPSAAFDHAARFLRRLGDDADRGEGNTQLAFAIDTDPGTPAMHLGALATDEPAKAPARGLKPWVEGYGLFASDGARNGVAGNERQGGGIAAGVGFVLAPGVTVGVALDQGWTHIGLDAVSEHANLQLLQGGVYALFERGPWVGRAAFVYGSGSISTTGDDPMLGASSKASYSLDTWGVSGEAGYRLTAGPVRVTPLVGIDWQRVSTGGFTETGGFAALTSGGADWDRTRVWVGFETRYLFDLGDRHYAFSGHARAVDAVSGTDRNLVASFVSSPGTPLTITGVGERHQSFDFGAALTALDVRDGLSLYIAYDGRVAGDLDAHAVTGGLKLRW